VPKPARDEIEKWANEATRLSETTQKLGGEHGLALATQLLPLVTDPNPSEQTIDGVMTALVGENPRLVGGMGQALINAALNDEVHGEPFASRLLTEEFGSAYNLDRIRNLVEFDKAGLINYSELKEDFETNRKVKTPEVEALEKRVQELEGGKQQEQETAAAQAESAKKIYSEKVDAHTKSTVNEAVAPIWKKMGWMPADGEDPGVAKSLTRFNSMSNKVLDLEMRETPEWAQIEALKEQNRALDKDGNPTPQYKAKLDNLKTRAEGIVIEAARDLQPIFAAGFKATRRSRLAGTNRERDPQDTSQDPPTGQQPQNPNAPRQSVEEQLAEMDRRFDAVNADDETRRSLGR
jgi:hypothetical protein